MKFFLDAKDLQLIAFFMQIRKSIRMNNIII